MNAPVILPGPQAPASYAPRSRYGGPRPRAAILQHGPADVPGLLEGLLAVRGYQVTVIRADLDPLPDAAGLDLLVSMGAPYGPGDPLIQAWAGSERELLAGAHDRGVPILGICFGAQMLAEALGGKVGEAARPEYGWLAVRTRIPDLLPPGPWLLWHRLTWVRLAGNAVEIADSPDSGQAFTAGPSLGLMPHLEASEDVVRLWLRHGGDTELAAAGADAGQMLEHTRFWAGESRQRAGRVLDAFLARAAAWQAWSRS